MERLLDLRDQYPDRVELCVFETKDQGGRLAIHPKTHLFFAEDAAHSVAFVGSSDLSLSALRQARRVGHKSSLVVPAKT